MMPNTALSTAILHLQKVLKDSQEVSQALTGADDSIPSASGLTNLSCQV